MSGCDHRHLLVVGAQRCGTTYLSRALDAHPDVTMARPSPPEPKVFCDAALSARGAESYHRTWFAHARDEAAPGRQEHQLPRGPAAPRGRAAEMLGEPEVVVLLRDPVRRAVSHWRFSTANGFETRDLEDALLADLDDEPAVGPAALVRVALRLPAPRSLRRAARALVRDVPLDHARALPEELLADPAVLTGLVAGPRARPGPYAASPTARWSTRRRASTPVPRCRSDGAQLEAYFEESNARLADQLGRPLPW